MKTNKPLERHFSAKEIAVIYGITLNWVHQKLHKICINVKVNGQYSVPESIVSKVFGGVEIADKVIYQTVTYHIYESKINLHNQN